MDINTLKDMGRDMTNFNKRDVLNALGLDTKETTTESILPMLGIFAAGLLTGIGTGLLLAPKSGSDMRNEIADRAYEAKDRIKETATEAKDRAKETATEAKDRVKESVPSH